MLSGPAVSESSKLQEVIDEYLEHTLKPAVWRYYQVLDQMAKEFQYDGFLHMIDYLRRYSATSLVKEVEKFLPVGHDMFRGLKVEVPLDFSNTDTGLGAKKATDEMMPWD
ncbi:hypothetical protein [Tumebacillus lipolyticus]|uniref:Uncharacterized protein n=1 Tax=Tumebacillus lipolyticus TaxID=1280370 RepID=A0ABW4ZZR7_9BACL